MLKNSLSPSIVCKFPRSWGSVGVFAVGAGDRPSPPRQDTSSKRCAFRFRQVDSLLKCFGGLTENRRTYQSRRAYRWPSSMSSCADCSKSPDAPWVAKSTYWRALSPLHRAPKMVDARATSSPSRIEYSRANCEFPTSVAKAPNRGGVKAGRGQNARSA